MASRILLADDSVVNVEVTTAMLEQLGYEVQCAIDGEEAVEIAEEDGPFDAIILDCQMPTLDGYQATKKIRLLPEFASTPIIALSGNNSDSHKERAYKVGMSDLLIKPVLLKDLEAMLNKWLSS